jgi:hypothetical protein
MSLVEPERSFVFVGCIGLALWGIVIAIKLMVYLIQG